MIYKIKRFSSKWFGSSFDIFDFLNSVKECNFPRKSKDLSVNTYDWDSNWILIDKMNRKENKRAKEILEDVKGELEKILKENNLGSINNYELYVVYLEKYDKSNEIFLEFGLEILSGKDRGKVIAPRISLSK